MEQAVKDFHLHTITPVQISSCPQLSGLKDRYFFIGSCFSGYVYDFFRDHFLHSMTSPFGNTYNPLSIAQSLSLLHGEQVITGVDVFYHNGLYRHFAFHTLAGKTDRGDFIRKANDLIKKAALYLRTTNVLVITFGTAFAFFHKKRDEVVNNCHTLPSGEFTRRLISVGEITRTLSAVLDSLKKQNPGLFIIFTLSPVRHLRDKAEENSLSKAILRCAIHELLALPDTWYFPSYEIMLDELRDYRYYANDLCHPDETAIRYIMGRFFQNSFTPQALHYLEKISRLRKMLLHKPRHPDTEQYKNFLKTAEKDLLRLQQEYPGMKIPGSVSVLTPAEDKILD